MTIQTINIGTSANDGTGDSIRDSFDKSNQNFAFLDGYRQNVVTNNLSASGNVSLNPTSASYWTGTIYLNGSPLATQGALFSGGTVAKDVQFLSLTDSTSNVTGAVQLSGGLGVAGSTYLTDLHARSLVIQNGISTNTLNASQLTVTAGASTGDLTINGLATATGNVTAANLTALIQLTASNAVINQGLIVLGTAAITGNVSTQSNVVALGYAAITGNVTAANVLAGNITASGNITTGSNMITAANITAANLITGNIYATGAATITGNVRAGNITAGIGTFGNVSVTSVPNNNSVTNKSYVNSLVVAFALGLGS